MLKNLVAGLLPVEHTLFIASIVETKIFKSGKTIREGNFEDTLAH
jgi:hypothetical protein